MKVLSDEDRSLLLQASQFDEAALAEIYDRFSPALYCYAMRLLGDQRLAEDCVSETFLRFLKALRSGAGPREHLQAYLYRISHNWITDHYRRQQPESAELPEEIADPDDLLEENLHHKDRMNHIRNALMTLTPEQRLVVTLKYLEEWSNEEIAQAIGKRSGAVKALLHRGVATLQRRIQVQEGENAI